jgi:hypothetical protein
VKEDILCRIGELGVFVRAGKISFEPLLLRRSEFLVEPGILEYFNLSGASRRLRLPPGSLAFTYCQVPVVYRLGHANGISVAFADGSEDAAPELSLDAATSRSIFERAGMVSRITVWLKECRP